MKSLILPLLILLGSLTAAYFTLEFTNEFKAKQKDRLDTKEENRVVTAQADAKEVELRQAEEVLEATKETRIAAQDRIANLEGNIRTLRSSIKDTESKLAGFKAQQKRFEDTSEQVTALANELNMSFTIDNIEQHLASMRDTKTEREDRVDELNTLIATAEQSIVENTSELARQVEREEERLLLKIDRSVLEAVITGVQQEWGYVLIGAGSNQGITPTTTLLVVRDGRMIGKVRPTTIDPSQTIADIVFSTLARGVRLQPGDTVIVDDPRVD